MPKVKFVAIAALVGALALGGPVASAADKNWTAPAGKITAQKISDEIMASHAELLSITFHGVPPGMKDTYTMFAGSYPDRIGNGDDPDDIDVQKLGITIADPRWHRTKDTVKKMVVMTPLRDAKGENVGLLVMAYKTDDAAKDEKADTVKGWELRDQIAKMIPSYAGLFEPAK